MNRQGQGGGGRGKFTACDTEEIQAILTEKQHPLRQPFWTLKQIAWILAERFSIHYSPRHLRRIVKHLGMYHYKLQPVDYRRSENAAHRLQQQLQAIFDVL